MCSEESLISWTLFWCISLLFIYFPLTTILKTRKPIWLKLIMQFSPESCFVHMMFVCWCCKISPLSKLHSECCYAHLKFNARIWGWHLIYHAERELLLSARMFEKFCQDSIIVLKNSVHWKEKVSFVKVIILRLVPASRLLIVLPEPHADTLSSVTFFPTFPPISLQLSFISGNVVLLFNKLVHS